MMQKNSVIIHKQNPATIVVNNDVVILVLGFFGASIKALAKKYGHLGEKFQKDVVGIVFPWKFMYFENSMREFVKSNLDSYFSNNPHKKSIILLVSSGGGTVMYPHFLTWANENVKTADVKAIMWEYCPGSITIPEYYRAATSIVNKKGSVFIGAALYSSIVITCKICDLITDYSDRVRNAPWSPELIPKSVCVEYGIANRYDPILDYAYVQEWIEKMKSLGRVIKHSCFESGGHLNAMKIYPEKYMEVWQKFMKEACAI